jgi:hypothetical protein
VKRDAVDLGGALGEGHGVGSLGPRRAPVNRARLAYPGAVTVE